MSKRANKTLGRRLVRRKEGRLDDKEVQRDLMVGKVFRRGWGVGIPKGNRARIKE